MALSPDMTDRFSDDASDGYRSLFREDPSFQGFGLLTAIPIAIIDYMITFRCSVLGSTLSASRSGAIKSGGEVA